jgi:hypothetical protein
MMANPKMKITVKILDAGMWDVVVDMVSLLRNLTTESEEAESLLARFEDALRKRLEVTS